MHIKDTNMMQVEIHAVIYTDSHNKCVYATTSFWPIMYFETTCCMLSDECVQYYNNVIANT